MCLKILIPKLKNRSWYFLGEDKNFNKYCMTMDQIRSTSVSVPLGLVFLAPKAAGADWKVLKNNLDKLKEVKEEVLEFTKKFPLYE